MNEKINYYSSLLSTLIQFQNQLGFIVSMNEASILQNFIQKMILLVQQQIKEIYAESN